MARAATRAPARSSSSSTSRARWIAYSRALVDVRPRRAARRTGAGRRSASARASPASRARLRAPMPTRPCARAAEEVVDWDGGTRIGESLKAFLDEHGHGGLARGARRPDLLGRARGRRPRPPRRADGAALPPRVPGRLAQPAPRKTRPTSRSPAACRRRSRTSTSSRAGTTSRASRSSARRSSVSRFGSRLHGGRFAPPHRRGLAKQAPACAATRRTPPRSTDTCRSASGPRRARRARSRRRPRKDPTAAVPRPVDSECTPLRDNRHDRAPR